MPFYTKLLHVQRENENTLINVTNNCIYFIFWGKQNKVLFHCQKNIQGYQGPIIGSMTPLIGDPSGTKQPHKEWNIKAWLSKPTCGILEFQRILLALHENGSLRLMARDCINKSFWLSTRGFYTKAWRSSAYSIYIMSLVENVMTVQVHLTLDLEG